MVGTRNNKKNSRKEPPIRVTVNLKDKMVKPKNKQVLIPSTVQCANAQIEQDKNPPQMVPKVQQPMELWGHPLKAKCMHKQL